MKPRWGVAFLPTSDIEEVVALARRAEELGFDSCWVAEDYFYGGAFSMATAIACATSRVRVGIGVINPFTRHPALIAMETAVLDRVSQGRSILGMGASNVRWIQHQMGIAFKRPLTAVREASQIIRQLLVGDKVTFKGKCFELQDVHLEASGLRDTVPIYLGVKGPKALQEAGRWADGVLLSALSSAPYVGWARQQIVAGATEAGRDVGQFPIHAYILVNIRADRNTARKQIRPAVAKYLGIQHDHPIMLVADVGPDRTHVFKEAVLRNENAAQLVPDDLLDLTAVAGSPDECKERVSELVAAGVTHPVAFQVPGVSFADSMEAIASHFF